MPAGFGEAGFTEKHSRFIGRIWPVESEPEAMDRIKTMRNQHRDAAHNVFAYVLRQGQVRYSDDGEPQGTSGLPTLNVLQSEGIHNVCCVVTRYFGGTLLGAGGLVRAYSKAAKLALDTAGINLMRQWDVMLVVCPYSFFERVKTCITGYDGVIESSEFSADICIQALVPVERMEQCGKALKDLSAGTLEATVIDKVFRGARLR